MSRGETLAELAARWGCSEESAALYQRKPRRPRAPALGEPRGASARIAAVAGPGVHRDVKPSNVSVHPPDELLGALVRIGELEQALAEERRRTFRGRAAARFDHVRAVRRAVRGGSRVRDLRQTLRLTRLMLARQQRARGAGGLKLHLVGGREQLRERLAELPSVGNPYASIPGKGRP